MQSDSKHIPNNANEGCPGAQSDQAGKGTACDGCPNQSLCATGAARQEDPTVEEVKSKMSNVKKIVLVLSGKGGVGKSTISSQLAWTLAQDEDTQVGLLDIDICGPSIPRLMGLEKHEVHQNNMGWEPVYVDDNLGVMSIGFMLPSKDDAVIWRGPRKNGLIKQFLTDVVWGELDYLIIDTPPGTSDQHISIAQYLKRTPIAGAIVVTTPQEVALLDVRKELNFCKKTGIPILGVVENMSGFKCPHCDKVSDIFVPTTGGAQKMCEDFDCAFLGKVPLDPKLLMSCEGGKSFVASNPDSPASVAFEKIAARVASI